MASSDKFDWNSLAFVCSKEVNPPFDDEADAWYRQARDLQKKDEEKYIGVIVRLYEQAIARNHYNAMHRLALLYVSGTEGLAVNEAKAVELVERVIKLNVPSGYYQMGVFLEQGIGVKQDAKASLTYMRRAADMGNPQAQFALGKKLTRMEDKEVRPRVVPIGKGMLECALSQGHSEAGYVLGVHYLAGENDVERGLVALQRAAALGNVQSLFSLSQSFSRGEDGVKIDSQRAACYERLYLTARDDTTKKFPEIDKVCPLPPEPMPNT
jgi:uncharacterized protein